MCACVCLQSFAFAFPLRENKERAHEKRKMTFRFGARSNGMTHQWLLPGAPLKDSLTNTDVTMTSSYEAPNRIGIFTPVTRSVSEIVLTVVVEADQVVATPPFSVEARLAAVYGFGTNTFVPAPYSLRYSTPTMRVETQAVPAGEIGKFVTVVPAFAMTFGVGDFMLVAVQESERPQNGNRCFITMSFNTS